MDRTVLINVDPKFFGGIQNSFVYKNISLNFLVQFVKQVANNYFLGDNPGTFFISTTNQPTSVLDRWRTVGDLSKVAKFRTVGGQQDINNAYGSDIMYSDASYLRLKNLSLSWQIPKAWRNAGHLQNARIYMQGQNLFTITKYKGLDPETRSSATLPPLKILTVGIQITL